jgi:hypothetical protein
VRPRFSATLCANCPQSAAILARKRLDFPCRQSERNSKALPKKSSVQKKHELKKVDKPRASTKQEEVLGLLRRPEGVTIAAIMTATR